MSIQSVEKVVPCHIDGGDYVDDLPDSPGGIASPLILSEQIRPSDLSEATQEPSVVTKIAEFEFADVPPISRITRLLHSGVWSSCPVSLAAQLLTVRAALGEYRLADEAEAVVVEQTAQKTDHLQHIALLTTTSPDAITYREVSGDKSDDQIVVVRGGQLVLSSVDDALTSASEVEELTAEDVKRLHREYAEAAQLPDGRRGAEVLGLYSADEREVVIAALRLIQRDRAQNVAQTDLPLLTHRRVDANDAARYFHTEATAILRGAGIHRGFRGRATEVARSIRGTAALGAFATMLFSRISAITM